MYKWWSPLARVVAAAGAVCLASGVARAQDLVDAAVNLPAGAPRSPVVAAVLAEQPPDIDGRLDDRVWRSATRVTRFVQQRPFEGNPASEQTLVLIAYDSEAIFLGVRASYSDPGAVRANRVDRDQLWRDDTVSVLFDPFLDEQRGYLFAVNGYGVQGDALLSAGGGGRRGGGSGGGGGAGRGGGSPGDSSWDALFASAGRLTESGWTAELAIPFKSLRYPGSTDGAVQRWGFQIQRSIQSKNENDVWAPVSRDVPGLLRQLGTLTGLRDISRSHNFEIQPTFTAIHTASLEEAGRGYATDGVHEAGANVKYGITPNLIFDATFNPDFSQIESDRPQIETNQRFPLFFPEQRPFFLEGQEAFDLRSPVRAIHTRTIVAPRYGAKISGKMGRTLLGVLVADDEAPGRVDDPTDPAFGRSAQVLLARARYDVYANSYVGAVVTDREFVDTFSRLAGVDGSFQFGVNRRLAVTAMTSKRRDGDGIGHAGHLFNADFQQRGRHLSYSLSHAVVDPGFGTDLGFVRRTDTRRTQGDVSYRWWPSTWILNWGPRVQAERIDDHLGIEQQNSLQGGVNVQFANNIDLNADYENGMERYLDVDFPTSKWTIGGGIATSRAISFRGRLERGRQIRFVDDPFLGTSTQISASVTVRPISRLQSEITLDSSGFVDRRTNQQEFDIEIWRALTTFQFSDRLLARNITQYDTYEKSFDLNLLLTYRVNAGTALYIGYDDHYQAGNRVDPLIFPTRLWRRTNRALFTKVQYLFRYLSLDAVGPSDIGAVMTGIAADALGVSAAMRLVAAVTCASGVIVAVRMTESARRSPKVP